MKSLWFICVSSIVLTSKKDLKFENQDVSSLLGYFCKKMKWEQTPGRKLHSFLMRDYCSVVLIILSGNEFIDGLRKELFDNSHLLLNIYLALELSPLFLFFLLKSLSITAQSWLLLHSLLYVNTYIYVYISIYKCMYTIIFVLIFWFSQELRLN